jgi:hypothetical protein
VADSREAENPDEHWDVTDVTDRSALGSASAPADSALRCFEPEDVGWTDEQVQALIDRHGGVREQSEAPW